MLRWWNRSIEEWLWRIGVVEASTIWMVAAFAFMVRSLNANTILDDVTFISLTFSLLFTNFNILVELLR